MTQSRYKPARTLVRRICRLPGEDRTEFNRKIARLREHFERFNVDVSDLCQWVMSFRPRDDENSGVPDFWNFFLDPMNELTDFDENLCDRCRLTVFDAVAQIRPLSELAGQSVPENLKQAVRLVAGLPKTPNANRLFERMLGLEPPHRLVLLKSAAEWIVARYQNGVLNWERNRAEWEKEKQEWETQHPQLTEQIRKKFTDVFRNLVDPENNDSKGIRRKKLRICTYERLRQNKNNCVYAGEKGHGALCWKFVEFVRIQKRHNNQFQIKFFSQNAKSYIRERRKLMNSSNLSDSKKHQEALCRLYRAVPQCKPWFEDAWKNYLKTLDLNDVTVFNHGCLPHCLKIGAEIWEKSKCEWNPHSHLCEAYKQALQDFDSEELVLESDYREWRRHFLAGPRKPSFRYPSSRKLPMPKIFGTGFHEIDFDRSVLRLRLEDMRQGEWMEFGFIPWPKDYRPGKNEVNVSSVHVNFVGSRARAGFRFEVSHRLSRFSCSQDKIDELRSRRFPRQAQDQQFVETARGRLLESFSGDPDKDLRILAVDLGMTGAYAAVYEGRVHQEDLPLPIVKIDQCYTDLPEVLEIDKQCDPPPKFQQDKDRRGLRKEHVGHHLEQLKTGVAAIAEYRQREESQTVTLRDSDFRSLTRHIRWMIRDWARHNAAQVVSVAEHHRCDLIVFESLRGFRPRGYDNMDLDQKRRLGFFAYGQIRRKVVEKAVERGMRVITVPYGYSSRICSACVHKQENEKRWNQNKRKRIFKCERDDCPLKLNSDANAARVLARVFWGEIHLPSRQEEMKP